MWDVLKVILLGWTLHYSLTGVTGDDGSNIKDKIFFQFYPGGESVRYTNYTFSEGINILDHANFNQRIPTIFYLHGFSENPAKKDVLQSDYYIVNAFGQYDQVNMIVVNYANMVKSTTSWNLVKLWMDYYKAVDNVPKIGRVVGNFIKEFRYTLCSVMCVYCPAKCNDKIHPIGFSIGAHMIHYIAEVLGEKKLKRATGIDPAGPGFITSNKIINKDDAEFVDIIHTDTKLFGYPTSIGTADFYPNAGHSQPVCRSPDQFNYNIVSWISCDHFMGMIYYSISIQNPEAFRSTKCKNLTAPCYNSDSAYMGYGVDDKARGNYYTNTGDTPVYGRDDFLNLLKAYSW